MTATVVRRRARHRCDVPTACITPEGVIVRCDDCGKTWECREDPYGLYFWYRLGWLALRLRGLR